MDRILDLIIVGAGPSGLAAAVAAGKAGLDYNVLEKGALVNSIFNFPRNMVFFTTPELLEIGGLPFTTPYEKPTRWEALRYYRRVADAYQVPLLFNEEVLSIRPVRSDADHRQYFEIETRLRSGTRRVHGARFVLLAMGYYDHPNLIGVPGEELPHVHHYYSEPHAYYRKQVIVVGGKNSAAIAALELFRGGSTVILVHRGSRLSDSIKYWIRPDIENRIKEGSIRALFETRLTRILPESVTVDAAGRLEELPAEAVFLMTGYHPDADLILQAGIRMRGDTMAPEYDAETMETNVPGLFVAGSIVSGRDTNKTFIENGRFHGEAVAKSILARLKG
jgi:bacillithiol disulfide reductase